MRPRYLKPARPRPALLAALVLAALLVPALTGALAQRSDDWEHESIRYTQTPAKDRTARLRSELERGRNLARDNTRGYLLAVLKALDVPVSSQTLVFSRTSLQRERISAETPRALYFNDDTYVGWVQGGGVIEVASIDPDLGAIFYTVDQDAPKAKLVRQSYECLSCHGSTLTRGVPGLTIRSVFADRTGLPILSAGTYVTTDESPWEERWGGWYVTGTHGKQRHLGNLITHSAAQAERPDMERGANVTDLRPFFDTTPYLTPHSDIVALMVLEHQSHVHNLITRAGYGTRMALHYEKTLNQELGRPAEQRLDSTLSRVRSVAEPLVRALLFAKEAPLTDTVRGTTSFAQEFAARGPRDRQGRSLRELDLRRRLFRYPCSFLIYSDAFDALPDLAKDYVYRRLREVLTGQDTSAEFKHLSEADRKAALEILTETKPEFAAHGAG
jgi:hypothetical protein